MVCDGNGNALTEGVQEHDARRVAQRIANDQGESVWLSVESDPGMGEEIEPEDLCGFHAAGGCGPCNYCEGGDDQDDRRSYEGPYYD